MDRQSMRMAAEMYRRRMMRRPWPMREPAPPASFSEVDVGDICPPWSYDAPTVAPPPSAHKQALPRDSKTVGGATIDEIGRAIANQGARQFQNPYTEPTPFSQDWDVVGSNDIPAALGVATRFRLARFKCPPGWVGVLSDINTNVPVALQPFATILPTINDQVMKSFVTQVFVGAGAVAPVETIGLPGIDNIIPDQSLHHPLQEEMVVGVEVLIAPGNPAGLIRAAMRGRYWVPDDATRYWNYAKAD